MLSPGETPNVERELHAAPPVNPRLRGSTRRAAWPTSSWFEPRRQRCGREIMVDLVGRAISEMFVRSMLVVPTDVERQLLPEPLPVKRNEHQLPCALGLDRSYQPLDHGDAAMLGHGTEPLTDTAATAPPAKPVVHELAALVGDQASVRQRLGESPAPETS